jgi:Tol biopolymer transport system component
VGDGVSGTCVAPADAGVDAHPDAMIVDGDTTLRCRVAFEDGPPGNFAGQGTREIWTAHIDGTGFVNVSNDPGDDFGASWAPSGLKIAFASNRRGLAAHFNDSYDIFTVNLDGTGLVNLTPNGLSSNTHPIWSPDGTRIAFDHDGKVWVMNADGSGAAPVSTLSFVDFMDWSPQSNKIVFDHFEMSGTIVPTIVVVTVGDGSAPVKLTSSNGPERSGSWNPSARIVFTSSGGDIVTANADGSSPFNVTMNPADQNDDPKWLDAGSTIVFRKNITGHEEVWSIPAGGGTAKQLTHNNVSNDIIADASPHGLIAFSRVTAFDASQLGIVDSNGTNVIFFNAPGGTNARAGRFSSCP